MFVHIRGYQFTALDELKTLQAFFINTCQSYAVKGTILLSTEGINLNLAVTENNLSAWLTALNESEIIRNMQLHQAHTTLSPYKRLKVKIKKEIISFRCDKVSPTTQKAARISPHELAQWLDEQKDFTLLDTRNDYEIQYGTFVNAVNLRLQHFTDFKHASRELNRDKPIVMFCTGGIRCEKAALLLANLSFKEVYQLDGGILNYFTQVGKKHYQGECFVFDDRVSVSK